MSEATITEPLPAPTPPPAGGAGPTPSSGGRRSVDVPVWLLVVAAGVLLVVGAFLVGRATAPDSEPGTLAEAVEETARGEMEVGDFDLRALIAAIRANEDLDLGILGDLLLGEGRR